MGLSGVPYAKTIKKRCLYSNYRLIHSAITNGLDYYKSTNYALYNIQMTHLNKFISVFRFLPATLRFALCFGRNDDLFCQEAGGGQIADAKRPLSALPLQNKP